jgi:glycosyltransferase involved in cell wall biosynthesis
MAVSLKTLLTPANKKTGLIVLACFFILFVLYHTINYIKFYIRVHNANTYLSSTATISPIVLEEDKKTITWMIHMYPPAHNAGAEWMAHAMNKSLIENDGYKVNVILNSSPVKDFERVHIIDKHETVAVDNAILHSSVLISHLDMETHAVQTALKAKRPFVSVMHNNFRKHLIGEFRRILPKNLYIIHNSKWLQKYYSEFNIPSIVVYPPVYWKEYNTPTSREYVTLINVNDNKGGNILINIAKAMPDVEFTGVKGGYDGQIIKGGIPNLTYMENTSHIQNIYAKTDILIVPSREETWGRVAIEAMSSGIPVIAHPTPGLLESCGSAGIFCDRNDTAAWVREIRRLKEDEAWREEVSQRCLARAKELDPAPQLRNLAKWLEGLEWRE